MQRMLAIDYGEKRMGLAISDPFGTFAIGLNTLVISPKTDVVATLKALCEEKEIATLIVGLPIMMDGEEGIQAQKVRAFVARLEEKIALPVVLLDERLTTVWAHEVLIEQGLSPSRNKEKVDELAAIRILQDYLDQQAARSGNYAG